MKKRAKAGNKKQGRTKAKASAKSRPSAKNSAKKARGKRKPTAKRVARQRIVVQGSQSVETVPMKGRAMRAGAGAGGGDFGGVSAVENVDSESAEELLEEGQAFEAGVVSGVEDAPDPDQGPVRTREVSQDDVPREYDDKDRPI